MPLDIGLQTITPSRNARRRAALARSMGRDPGWSRAAARAEAGRARAVRRPPALRAESPRPKVDEPIACQLPARIRSVSTARGFARCRCRARAGGSCRDRYGRSAARRSEASRACVIQRRELPVGFAILAHRPCTWWPARRCHSGLQRLATISLRLAATVSVAVSIKLLPKSRALWMMLMHRRGRGCQFAEHHRADAIECNLDPVFPSVR